MKIQYWGTAAAEGIPGIFCDCAVCREAREKKGKYVRTRSQLLLDDELLIDFNADTYMHSLLYDFNLSQIKDVIITHVHEDHYYPKETFNRRKGYAHDMKFPTLTFHGSPDLRKTYEYYTEGNVEPTEQNRIAFEVLEKYKTYEISGFEVVSLPATHGTPDPRVYIFTKEGKTFFMLNDSGLPCDEVFEWIARSGIKFDAVSYDCTFGDGDTEKAWGKGACHMGIANIKNVINRFKENGNYKPSTVNVITHFSHNGISVGYGDMKKIADENGFVLAYDGMTLEI